MQKHLLLNMIYYIHFLFLFIVCIMPSIVYAHYTEDGGLRYVFSSIVYVLPFVYVIVLIKNIYIRIFFELILFLCTAMEIVMLVQYNNYLVAGNILAILSTTYGEGWDFVCNSWKSFLYLFPLIITFLFLIKFNRFNIRNKKYCLITFFISLLLSISFIFARTYKANQTLIFYVEQNVFCRPPYNFMYQLYNVGKQQWVRRQISASKKMKFCSKRDKDVENREIYVLAIGESCRYANLSLSGYSRKTTPRLDSTRNVTLFSNYYSTACLTMYSVPQIITRATPVDFELCYKEKTVLQPFRECGFETFVIAHKLNLLSYEKFLTYGATEHIVVEDDAEIPAAIDSISNIFPKCFFIVQFLGSHSTYRNFKKEQNLFSPNPISDDVSWDNMDAMVNAYDNTILYTDFVLSSIIKGIDKDSVVSAMLFVSDHGEDFRPGSGGHGGTAKPQKEEYHVPMIFWHSDMWSAIFPEKKKAMFEKRNNPLNADNVFYSLCDMANLCVGEQYRKDCWSVFSENYVSHERLLLLPDGVNTLKLK